MPLAAALSAVALSAVALWAAGSPDAGSPPALEEGSRVERPLAGGETHRYRLSLAAGHFLRLRLEQRGVDVVLRLLDGAGVEAVEVDSLTGSWGNEVVSRLAPETVSWELEVAAPSAASLPGTYLLVVEALRPATASDRLRLAADEAMETAFRHFRERTPEGYAQALAAAGAARGTWRELGDAERRAEAAYLIGACHRRLRQGDEALAALAEALELFTSLDADPAVARVLDQTGRVHSGRGDSAAALAAYGRSLELWRQVGDAAAEGTALNNLGLQHHRAGRYRQALERYREALPLFRRTGNRHRETVALNNLAVVYERLGEPDPAFEHHRRVLARSREDDDRDLEARTLNNLGYLHRRLGEPQEALAYYREALEIFHELGEPALEATAWHNLGALHQHLGQPERALDLLERALALRRRAGDRGGEAETLTRVGGARLDTGEPEAARAALESALELRLASADRDGEATTRTVLGRALEELGDASGARGHYAAALAIQRAIEDRYGEAATLRRLAGLDAEGGEAAMEALERSLDLSRAVRDPEGVARSLRLMARAELSRGRLDEARERLELALAEIEASRARVIDAELRSAFSGRRQSAHELYVEVLMRLARERSDPDLVRAAFEASERARARGLVELLAEAALAGRHGVDPDLAERRRQLSRRLRAKAALEARAGDGEEARHLRREVEELADELRAVEVEIRRRHPRYMELLEPPRVRTGELQEELLGDGTMLLEYALGEERSHLWALTANGLDGFELPPRRQIEELARRAHADLGVLDRGRREARCRGLAALGETLLGPVAGRLGDRRLVVVPDGALHYLPFAAFGDPRGGDPRGGPQGDPGASPCARPPLVERHEVVALPSAAALLELRSRLGRRAPASRAVAVLADPVFAASDPRVAAPGGAASAPGDGEELPRLPWSRREAEAIAAVAGGSRLEALDFAANRAAVAALGDFRVVHFATHGVLDSRRPELSGLVLSLVDRQGRPDDGYLRLHDVYGLELSAELVVLSGCRTALGREIRGEGLVGLTRGFFYAGAARVLASLWRIDDRATAELMGRFYRQLLHRGAPPAEALRQAQRALRREARWRDPYYWAAFTLQGEWNAFPKT